MDIKRHYDIQSLPTIYKGINFRSRIEARWAVFFDELHWPWQYEKQYYKLPSGNYLPDFYFPYFNAHGEVKPNKFTSLERLKCIELSIMFPDTDVLQLVGTPTFSDIKIITNGGDSASAIPVPVYDKFYPLFYTNIFDINYFEEKTIAIFKATEYIF